MSSQKPKKTKMTQSNKDPLDIIKYLIFRYSFDGELITNLKLQKILYYVYVCNLSENNNRCFKERFQAWPIGPALPSVYSELKKFGSFPVDSNFSKIKNNKDLMDLKGRLGKSLLEAIDKIYMSYGTLSAFELVSLTHNDISWKRARKGLDVTEKSKKELSDKDILIQYVKKQKR